VHILLLYNYFDSPNKIILKSIFQWNRSFRVCWSYKWTERNFRNFISALVYPASTSQVKIDTHRIEELGKFAKIVPPACFRHSEAHRAGRIIYRLASEAVTFRPTAHKILKQYSNYLITLFDTIKVITRSFVHILIV